MRKNLLLEYNLDKSHLLEDYMVKKSHILRTDLVIKMLHKSIKKHAEDVVNRNFELLSIGCSTGIIEEKIMNKLNIPVHGIDGDEVSLAKARKKGLTTTTADVTEKLPFKDESFELVFAGELVEHIVDARSFFKEVRRITKKGGSFVLTTPNLARFADRVRFLFGKTPKHSDAMHEKLFLHVRPFTLDSLKKILEYSGFKVEQVESTWVGVDPTLKLNWKSRFLAKLFPGLGKHLIVKAVAI